ncbi:hypothetical protein [Geothrix limicola]|uniref:hypothetical protein n=1 Tax=Geothrix limicola TaxID=2927978 RepID=UPI002553E316|nr:hypothetical protein [Geothrix limicola]
MIWVALFTVNAAAAVPLKATAEALAKLLPEITTAVPAGPLAGLKLLSVGKGPGLDLLASGLDPPPPPHPTQMSMPTAASNIALDAVFQNMMSLSRGEIASRREAREITELRGSRAETATSGPVVEA